MRRCSAVNAFVFSNCSSLSVQEQLRHPDWVGKRRKMVQLIEETQQQVGGEVFV